MENIEESVGELRAGRGQVDRTVLIEVTQIHQSGGNASIYFAYAKQDFDRAYG